MFDLVARLAIEEEEGPDSGVGEAILNKYEYSIARLRQGAQDQQWGLALVEA